MKKLITNGLTLVCNQQEFRVGDFTVIKQKRLSNKDVDRWYVYYDIIFDNDSLENHEYLGRILLFYVNSDGNGDWNFELYEETTSDGCIQTLSFHDHYANIIKREDEFIELSSNMLDHNVTVNTYDRSMVERR